MHFWRQQVWMGLLLGLGAACAQGAWAQEGVFEFRLVNGGVVQGQWLNRDQQASTTYVIRPACGGQLVLKRKQVKKVIPVSSKLLEYERRKRRCPNTVEGHWELARWCQRQGLRTQRRYHLRCILELDPDHAEARRGLGYVYDPRQEKWILHEELMIRRGYVKVGGRWMLPQEVKLLEERRQRQLAQKQWLRTLLRWHRQLDSPHRRQEAVRRITSINDPHAVPALAELLSPKRERRYQVRLILLEALNNIDTPEARSLMAQVALFDPHEEVWMAAAELLAQRPDPAVVKLFIKHLKHPNNAVINRAAVALGMLKDPSAIGPLIESLITVHTYRYRLPLPEYRYSFGRSPGVPSVAAVGSPERVERYVFRNQAVLEALVKITGVNFGYELEAWQQWYAAQQKTQLTGSLRRDQ